MRRTRRVFGRRAAFPQVGVLFADRYRLEAQLGSGGGSVVFRAHDRRLDRRIAIKLIAPNELDEQGLERFRREALSVARLTHPGIVTIYDFDEVDDLPYLTLELAPGDDLWTLMYERDDDLPMDACLTIILNILDALAYAHQQGVVHRDLKPENVMVAADYSTKVTDFGLAHIRGQKRITGEHVIAGSAYYMAPEVARGESVDHRIDLYALGVMLYELAAGRLPFFAEDGLAIIAQHVHEPPPPPSEFNPEISPVLEAVILKLLSKKPDDRYPTARAVRLALTNLELAPLDGDGISKQTLLDRIERSRPPGREAEWGQLRESWQYAVAGARSGRTVAVIAGEAGSGKGEIAQQLMEEAGRAGALALSTQCFLTSTPLPYQPFIELLRDYLRDHRVEMHPQMAADLIKLVPEIANDYEVGDLPPLPPEAERLRLFEHVTQLLIEASRQQPILILVEYWHCTDASSLELLHYVARHISGHPIFIMGTYRPSELNLRHPLEDFLRELLSQEIVEHVLLRRLTAEESDELIESIFGAELDPAFTQVIYETAQGNVFFTRELIKSFVIDDLIYWDADASAWHLPQVSQIELPGSIRSIVGHQLGKLSDVAMEILPAAAIIGPEFRLRLLAEVTGSDEDTLADALDEAVRARLLEERADLRDEVYQFANLAIHQTLQEKLSQRQKTRWHLKIAKAYERRYAHQLDEHIEMLARHYSQGARTDADITTAIVYLAQAAQRATEIHALPTALDLYNHALELSQEDVSPERDGRVVDLHEKRGVVHQQLGDFAAGAADFEFVLHSPEINQDQSRKRAALLRLGQVYRRDERFDSAIEMLTDAVEISRTMNDERAVADALYYLGATYWSLGKINQALVHHEDAYEIVTRLGLEDEVAMRVLHGLAETCERSVDYQRMVELAEKSLRLAHEANNLEYQAENYVILGWTELNRGDYERAQAYFESRLEDFEQAGLRWHATAHRAAMGLALAKSGDYEIGIRRIKEALVFCEKHFKGFLVTMLLDFLGRCYLDLDAYDLANETFSKAIDRAQRSGISWSDASIKAGWALAQIRLGNLDVGGLLEETLDQSASDGDRVFLPLLYHALAELELARDNPAGALDRADEMQQLASLIDQPAQIIQADILRGKALLKLQRFDAARAVLEAAVESSVMIRSPRLTWLLHQALGEAYTHTDQPEKAKQCRRRVNEAIDEIMSNINDPALRGKLKLRLPSREVGSLLTTTLRLLVITDSFGTVVQESIRENIDEVQRCDAMILLGDLPANTYPSLREELGLEMRGICVLGNHDDDSYESWLPRYGFEYIHLGLASIRMGGREITLGGFSGSEQYASGQSLHWTDEEAARLLSQMPACDILLTHTAAQPPEGYPPNRSHMGLAEIGAYIERAEPKIQLHGHFHRNYQALAGQTQVIGCYGAVLVQCMIGDDDDWRVEVQPLLTFAL